MNFFPKVISYSRDGLAVLGLLLVYHGYELLCYVTGNMFHYYVAVGICAGVLFLISVGLIYLHDFFLKRFSWDALRLQYLNNLRQDDQLPSYQVLRRLTRLVLRNGFWAVFFLGPIILGPFIVTLLLRKRKTWCINLSYALSGAFLNALFWVAFMRGVRLFTWRYIAGLGGALG
jgi:hypothetical protein